MRSNLLPFKTRPTFNEQTPSRVLLLYYCISTAYPVSGLGLTVDVLFCSFNLLFYFDSLTIFRYGQTMQLHGVCWRLTYHLLQKSPGAGVLDIFVIIPHCEQGRCGMGRERRSRLYRC